MEPKWFARTGPAVRLMTTKRNLRSMLADSILERISLDRSMRFGQKAGLVAEENGHKKVV